MHLHSLLKIFSCIKILPLQVEDDSSVTFAFFSLRTLISLILCFGTSLINQIVAAILNYSSGHAFNGEGSTEWVSFIGSTAIHCIFFPCLPVLLAAAFGKVPELSLHEKAQNSGKPHSMILISILLHVLALILAFIFDETNGKETDYNDLVVFIQYSSRLSVYLLPFFFTIVSLLLIYSGR